MVAYLGFRAKICDPGLLVAKAEGMRQTLDFYEVKRDRARIDLNDLERKSKAFLDKNPEKRNLRRTLSGLSLEDM